jgi:DHA1 family tetracycline resistance protein-like MFS transporter
MTRRVSANEQGELQGANSAILAFASMFGPVLFGWLYARSVPDAPGLSFYVAAALLAAGAALAWRTTGSPAEGPQHEAIRN